jgi:hypothetical protein
MTSVNGFIDRQNVKGPKGVPIDGLHVNGQVFLAKNHRLIPIRIKLKPKPYVRIKFLLPKSGDGVPLLVHIVVAGRGGCEGLRTKVESVSKEISS